LRREGSLAQPRQWRGWSRFGGGFAAAWTGNEADFNAFGGINVAKPILTNGLKKKV